MSQRLRQLTKTTRPTTKGLQRDFYILDASKEPLGRLASKAAKLLMGKNKANYAPDVNVGGVVVIINAKDIVLTGQKATRKNYFNYSGNMGGMKVRSFPEQMAKDCTVPILRAVRGMLPKNRHRDIWSNQLLHIFPENHNLPNKMIIAN